MFGESVDTEQEGLLVSGLSVSLVFSGRERRDQDCV